MTTTQPTASTRQTPDVDAARTAPRGRTATRTTHTTVDSPLGPLTLVADDGTLAGVFMAGQKHLPDDDRFGAAVAPDEPEFDAAVRELREYFAGERDAFDVDLAPRGTAFQRAVWDRLRRIPFGVTTTYGTIARDLGLPPGASRAVGAAVGRNPLSVVVPCHRVVGSTGALTGYAGGIERKTWLLEHEGVLAAGTGTGTGTGVRAATGVRPATGAAATGAAGSAAAVAGSAAGPVASA